MLIESLVFAALGTAAGLAIAAPLSVARGWSRSQRAARSTRTDCRPTSTGARRCLPRPSPARRGVLAGLAPALKLARADVSDTLRQTTPRRHRRPSADAHPRRRRSVTRGGVVDQRRPDDRQPPATAECRPRDCVPNICCRCEFRCRPVTTRRSAGSMLVRQLTRGGAARCPAWSAPGIVTVNPLDRGSFGAAIESEDQPLAAGQSAPIVNHRLVTRRVVADRRRHARRGPRLRQQPTRPRACRSRSSAGSLAESHVARKAIRSASAFARRGQRAVDHRDRRRRRCARYRRLERDVVRAVRTARRHACRRHRCT